MSSQSTVKYSKVSFLLQDAFVEFLNGPYLFKSMLKGDPEAEILHSMPEVAQLLQTYPLWYW